MKLFLGKQGYLGLEPIRICRSETVRNKLSHNFTLIDVGILFNDSFLLKK
jgi:hypothetical protein